MSSNNAKTKKRRSEGLVRIGQGMNPGRHGAYRYGTQGRGGSYLDWMLLRRSFNMLIPHLTSRVKSILSSRVPLIRRSWIRIYPRKSQPIEQELHEPVTISLYPFTSHLKP